MATQQTVATTPGQQVKKPTGSIKIYKCVSCDYKTPELKQFQVHYEECRIKNAQCRICKKIFANANVMKQHMQEKHGAQTPQQQVAQTGQGTTVLYNCSHCQFQTTDKPMLEEHLKTHNKKIVKIKPFKCRLCSMRFESREQATVHAKSHQQAQQAAASAQQQQQPAQQTYFKCGACSATFPQKDLLVKHFETHRKPAQPKVQVQQVLDKTRMLQDSIEEALREPKDEAMPSTAADANKINFFSCNICSLTFLQENYYNSHMETHKQKSSTVVASATTKAPIVSSRISTQTTSADIKIEAPVTSDIESIFEKMHSEDAGDSAASAGKKGDKNLVITTQENNGGITFNITIPTSTEETTTSVSTASKVVEDKEKSKPIDMPILDPTDEPVAGTGASDDSVKKLKTKEEKNSDKESENSTVASGPPVSMPSLDDEGEITNPATDATASEETQQSSTEAMETDEKQEGENVANETEGQTEQTEEQLQTEGEEHGQEGQQLTPMELEGIEDVESGNIKFIINENGQLIQLDENHILTTDADGNQILVQGAGDSEQIQQLLQSVGAFTEGDGSGQQMVLVQGEGDGEAQLIDASQLINTADGHHIVIQQGDMTEDVQLEEQEQDGETVAVSYADA